MSVHVIQIPVLPPPTHCRRSISWAVVVCTCVCFCLSVCLSDFVPLLVPALEPEHELFLVYGKGRPGIIRGMDMGAKVPDEHMIPIENLMNPRALDFHAETGFIYFADTTSYLIGRQKIDGTERETILKDGKGPRVGGGRSGLPGGGMHLRKQEAM